MSRDYKNHARYDHRRGATAGKSRREGRASLWRSASIGLLAGVGMAVLIALLVRYRGSMNPAPAEPALSTVITPTAITQPKPLPPRSAANGADGLAFYSVLEGNADIAVNAASNEPVAATDHLQYIQVAVLAEEDKANNLKARLLNDAALARLGVKVSIQTIKISDNTWEHKVRLGPFSQPEHTEAVLNILKNAGIAGVKS
jgi:cell division protein FtsN